MISHLIYFLIQSAPVSTEVLVAIIVSGFALVSSIGGAWLNYRSKNRDTTVGYDRSVAEWKANIERSVNEQEEKMRADLVAQYDRMARINTELRGEFNQLEMDFKAYKRLSNRRIDAMERYILSQPDGETILSSLPPRPNGMYT